MGGIYKEIKNQVYLFWEKYIIITQHVEIKNVYNKTKIICFNNVAMPKELNI